MTRRLANEDLPREVAPGLEDNMEIKNVCMGGIEVPA